MKKTIAEINEMSMAELDELLQHADKVYIARLTGFTPDYVKMCFRMNPEDPTKPLRQNDLITTTTRELIKSRISFEEQIAIMAEA